MEAFSADVKQRTGLALSFSEAHKLYSLYYNPNSKSVDYTKLYADLLDGTEDSSQQSAPKTASTPVRLTFEEVIDMINDRVQQKLDYSIGGERLKKMTSLLSEGRSTVLTKPQLRSTCKLRLDIVLSDHEVDSIFGRLDPQKSGIIKVKELIRTFKKPVAEQDMSLSIGGNEILPARKEAVRTKGSEAARISFDGQFLNLVPPDPRDCPLYSVWEIENIIRERITESGGSFTGSSTKTAQRMFGSGGHYTGDLRISLDQLRFTFWKTFRLDVSDSDLQRFFQRYETDGAILLSRLIAGIFREASADTARSSPAVVEVAMPSAERVSPAADAVPSAPAPQINSLDAFFATVRQQVNQLLQKEGRAPNYLLNGTSRLTPEQAKQYFRKKLGLDLLQFTPDLIAQVLQAYTYDGLVDMKKLFTETVIVKEPPAPAVENIAISTWKSPEELEKSISERLYRRFRENPSQAALHELFHGSDASARTVTRQGMRRVLTDLEISVTAEDVGAFFVKHQGSDGTVDVQKLLTYLQPTIEVSAPKVETLPAVSTPLPVGMSPASPALRPQSARQVSLRAPSPAARPKSAGFFGAPQSPSPQASSLSPAVVLEEPRAEIDQLLQHLRNRRLNAASGAAVYRPSSAAPAASLTSDSPSLSPRPPSSSRRPASSPRAGSGYHQPSAFSEQVSMETWDDSLFASTTAPQEQQPTVMFADNYSSLTHEENGMVAGSHHFAQFPPSRKRPTSAPAGKLATGARLHRADKPAEETGTKTKSSVELQVSGSGVGLPNSQTRPLTARDDGAMQELMQGLLKSALMDLNVGGDGSCCPSPKFPSPRASSPASPVRPRSAAPAARHVNVEHAVQLEESVVAPAMDQSALLRHLAEAYDSLETVSLAPKGRTGTGSRASPRAEASVLTEFRPVSSMSKSRGGGARRPTSAPAGSFPEEYLFGTPRADTNALTLPAPRGATQVVLSGGVPAKPVLPAHQKVPVLQGIREDQVVAVAKPAPSPRRKSPTRPDPEQQHLYKLDLAYLSGVTATEAAAETFLASQPETTPRTATASSPRKFHTTSTVNGTSSRTASAHDAVSSPRYVYTGQRRQYRTDPHSPYLTCQYKLSLKHVVTSQGEYGFFAKTLARTRRQQSRLREKQLNSTK